MPLLAVGLVLASCVLHAFWNLLVKRAHNKLAFTALYLCSATLLYLPLFLILLPGTRIPALGWLCVAGTAVVYFGYFIGLALTYESGELSVAYPVIRGLGPALTFVGGILFLAERPTLAGAIGVLLILSAVVALTWRCGPSRSAGALPSTLTAMFVAVTYSAYSLIDKVAVGRLRISPPIYVYLTFVVAAALVVPYLVRRLGLGPIREEWRSNGIACVAVGGLNLFTYGLVLVAMSLPNTPVGYVTPLRATSVLIGVLLGAGVLREGRLLAKLCAALLMMVGIALMAWKG